MSILQQEVAGLDFSISNEQQLLQDSISRYVKQHCDVERLVKLRATETGFDAEGWQSVIGQRTGLSYWDEKTMSFMYPESNWRFLRLVNLNPPSNGQFQSPWTVFDTAVADTPVGGRLIILNPQTYIEPGVYSKPMIIEAPQGGVTIRAN